MCSPVQQKGVLFLHKKQQSNVCKVQCKAQANNAHTKYTNPIDKKVKLFSSGRPPQQESYSPTETHTHTFIEEPLGSAVLCIQGKKGSATVSLKLLFQISFARQCNSMLMF